METLRKLATAKYLQRKVLRSHLNEKNKNKVYAIKTYALPVITGIMNWPNEETEAADKDKKAPHNAWGIPPQV